MNSAVVRVAVSGSTQPSILPRAGPTIAVPCKNAVNASAVPTSTTKIVMTTDWAENETEIVQRAKNHEDKVFRVSVISSGDPLEIYTEKDGEVIFKKYSPMGDLTDFAAQICESIGKNTGHIAAVSDRDAVIAAYGVQRRELMDKHCSQELEQLMEARKIYRYQPGQAKIYPSDASERYYLGVSAPILSEGDLMGCVMLLLEEQDAPLGEAEQKLVQTVAGFLGRQMEN